jgi:hypothetical protein
LLSTVQDKREEKDDRLRQMILWLRQITSRTLQWATAISDKVKIEVPRNFTIGDEVASKDKIVKCLEFTINFIIGQKKL